MKNSLKTIFLIAILTITGFSYAGTPLGYTDLTTTPSQEETLKAQVEYGPIGQLEGWDLVTNKNGIKIYLRRVEITHINSCKGVMEVEENFSRLVQLFFEDENYTEWMYMVDESRVLKRVSETELYVYTHNKIPWPASNRDAITFKWWYQDPETLVTTAKYISVPDYIPEKEGAIRVALLQGKWTFTPRRNGNTIIEYEQLIEPGGWIPLSIANGVAKYQPYFLLKRIKKMLPLKSYEGKSLRWLKVK